MGLSVTTSFDLPAPPPNVLYVQHFILKVLLGSTSMCKHIKGSQIAIKAEQYVLSCLLRSIRRRVCESV